MIDKNRVPEEGTPSDGRTLWAYGYEMIPPHREDRMKAIRGLLNRENTEAKRTARNWTGRLVTEEQVTHLLIVSAGPDFDLEINRKVEAQLNALGVKFLVTVPMPLSDGLEPGRA
ncbi:MAG: hypothetical protein WEG36_16440 [Gemmatimonadota bacterium]